MYKKTNKFVIESRDLPIVKEADVVVAGSGPAGIGAALASARTGAKTVILEREFALGGMMTTGLMSKIAISSTIGGIAVEIIDLLTERNMALKEGHPEIPIDPEATKLLLDEILLEEGVEIMLGSPVVDAIKENNEIVAVVTENKSGRQAIKAKVFIDATGDGDLAARAGADFILGREEDNICSAPTLMYRIANVDLEKTLKFIEDNPENIITPGYREIKLEDLQSALHDTPKRYAHFGRFQPLIRKIMEENEFSEWEKQVLWQRDGILFFNLPAENQVLVNTTRIPYVSGVDAEELSNAMIEGRKQANFIFNFLKEYFPGFENSYIVDTAGQMGIRESRHIIGEYAFTEDDVLGNSRFEDVIVRNQGGIEIHKPEGGTHYVKLKHGEWYDIPYRSIIVKGLDNLLVIGRCFSASHSAQSAARSIGFCLAQGEASGVAAALASTNNIPIREISIKEMQSKLDL